MIEALLRLMDIVDAYLRRPFLSPHGNRIKLHVLQVYRRLHCTVAGDDIPPVVCRYRDTCAHERYCISDLKVIVERYLDIGHATTGRAYPQWEHYAERGPAGNAVYIFVDVERLSDRVCADDLEAGEYIAVVLRIYLAYEPDRGIFGNSKSILLMKEIHSVFIAIEKRILHYRS